MLPFLSSRSIPSRQNGLTANGFCAAGLRSHSPLVAELPADRWPLAPENDRARWPSTANGRWRRLQLPPLPSRTHVRTWNTLSTMLRPRAMSCCAHGERWACTVSTRKTDTWPQWSSSTMHGSLGAVRWLPKPHLVVRRVLIGVHAPPAANLGLGSSHNLQLADGLQPTHMHGRRSAHSSMGEVPVHYDQETGRGLSPPWR